MYTGPSELQNLAADFFERAEIKNFLAAVTEISSGAVPALLHSLALSAEPGNRAWQSRPGGLDDKLKQI
jgi:hypothetical protein